MTTWESINKLGKSKLLATSYIWLVLVPIMAKTLSAIETPLNLSKYVPGLVIHLSLPFSWQLFYFSAVVISLAGAIYYFRCPEIIKNFSTYADFQREGRDASYLLNYADRLNGFQFTGIIAKWNDRTHAIDPDEERRLSSTAFWQIYNLEKNKFLFSRLLCFLLYAVGIALIIFVLLKNFQFVLQHTHWYST